MQRLCGRPGCSDIASVAYGMRAEDLVFWLDNLATGSDRSQGALCRRHADTMVVPRGWTLDDLRDPDLHLFRPPDREPTLRRAPTRVPRRPRLGEQLTFAGADIAASAEGPEPADDHDRHGSDDDPGASSRDVQTDEPWTPSFDEADDLGGLLAAQSPLLSRAFRTADRHDR